MAKNDNGLYLPLKINLSEWERSLAEADADLQKLMREMRSSMSDLKLRYDVEIAGAKAAGNDAKALELENQKLNRIYEEQKKAVEALNRAYQQSVKDKGADAKASQDLAKQLVRESKQLDRIQQQMNAKGLNLGKSLSDSLAYISPEFARIRQATANITGSLSEMGGSAILAAKAIGGIGLAAAGIGAVVTGLNAITDSVNDIAKAGVNASDPIYQLRESIQGTYEDAKFLYGVTAVDGSNAESLANSLTKLTGTLQKDTDGTNSATIALKKYGAELLNTDRTAKTYREQLLELSKAAQTAAKVGQFQDFKAALPGAFRSTEFDHLLLGLENYIALAKGAQTETEILYDKLHRVTDATNTRNYAQQQLDAVRGGIFADASVKNLEYETDTLIATANLIGKNREELEEYGETIGNLTNNWVDFKGTAELTWESIKMDIASAIGDLGKYKNVFAKLVASASSAVNFMFPGSKNILFGEDSYVGQKYNEAQAKKDEERQKVRLQREQAQKEALEKQQQQRNAVIRDVQVKKEQQEEQKKLDFRKKFYAELRDIQATEYEREINAIKDKRDAYIAGGMEEVEADKLFALQKQQIDDRYYQKANEQRQKQIKQAQEAYNKEVELARRSSEEQKKAREQAMSDAESALRTNLKLARYIQEQQKKGTYNESDAKKYAEQMYMRQQGYRMSDISFLKDFGVDKLKDIANARDRLFSQFAPPTTNNITVNFDNTVVEDQAALQRIADKVAEVITPAINEALRGGQYGY